MSENRHPHWRVSVETSGELIVSIETEMLAGRDLSEADEDAIRTAAHHLLAFIGDPAPREASTADDLAVARRALEKVAGRAWQDDENRQAGGIGISLRRELRARQDIAAAALKETEGRS